MKFIASSGAPDIPLKLQKSQESAELVIFCGAGISCQAGLPTFRTLIKNIYSSLHEEMKGAEKKYFKLGAYDAVLELLEDRIEGDIVRKNIIEQMTMQPNADLSTHKAILELAKIKNQPRQNAYRLVTTNVDKGFALAGEPKLSIEIAPALTLPKAHKWYSVVQLHGMVENPKDDNGEALIFTSGDFGSAYLTERWASRFLTELFRNFTVLFIGYSVNDPVIRYITDAISAEKKKGSNEFRQPYIIAHSVPSKSEQSKQIWESKNIIPILYSGSHKNFHKTLIAWAEHSRDGINSWLRIIRKEAPKAPSNIQDVSTKRIIDTLNRSISENLSFPPDAIIKEFIKLGNIGWLTILEKENLLPDLYYDQLQPATDKTSKQHLFDWFVEHLDKQELIDWVIRNNGYPPSYFVIKVLEKLKGDHGLTKAYLLFWQIFTANHYWVEPLDGEYRIVIAVDNLKNEAELPAHLLAELIQPVIVLKSTLYENHCNANAYPFNAEVTIKLEDYDYRQLKEDNNYPAAYIDTLLAATNALNQAMKFWKRINQTDEKHDISYWQLPSIESHEQNKTSYRWVILIKLCRDLWTAAYNDDNEHANAILQLWQTLKYPVFRRLALFAYTKMNDHEDIALDYLLEDNHIWLWSPCAHREKFRLLEKIVHKLTNEKLDNLFSIVLQGPPRELYRNDLSENEWLKSCDSNIWLLLAKLKSYNITINSLAEQKYNELSQKYPNWVLQGNEKDEFSTWIEARFGYEIDISESDLINLDVPKRVAVLTESSKFHAGRINEFKNMCKNEPQNAVDTLKYLIQHSQWNEEVWNAALFGLSQSNNPAWEDVSCILIEIPNELFNNLSQAIADWTASAITNLAAKDNNEKRFWIIARKLILFSVDDNELTNDTDIIIQAINHPIGIITNAFIAIVAKRNLKVGEQISEPELINFLTLIVNNKSHQFLLGRVLLARSLAYFYFIDPLWTKNNLIPLLCWNSSAEAQYIWEGYLSLARISLDLVLELKAELKNTLDNEACFSENYKTQLHSLIVDIWLEFRDIYNDKEKQEMLETIAGNDGLGNIAFHLYKNLSNGDDNDAYWDNRIQPLIADAWPKEKKFITVEVTENFVLALITLKSSFAKALHTIGWLLPRENLSDNFWFAGFFSKLAETTLPENYPNDVLKLLECISLTSMRFGKENLRNIYDRLMSADNTNKGHTTLYKIQQWLANNAS